MDKQVDMRRVQELVADLRDPRPGIFYGDLLLSAGLGWACFAVAVLAGWAWVGAWAIATLNTIRALGGTHLYVEEAEGRDARGQLLDSLNVDSNGLVAILLCPVGLRFHALHHVAPYLPYHAMPTAHRRLMEQLPAGSEYHQVTVRSLGEGIARLRSATSAIRPAAGKA